jgi:hypothetical protein
MITDFKLIFDPLFAQKVQRLFNDLVLSQKFFQKKDYGSYVREISGGLVCETDYQLRFIGLGQEYNKRKKMISFLVKMDYDFVKDSDETVVYEKSINTIIDAFKEFSKLGIKDFNVDEFIKDFTEYIALVKNASDDELEKLLPPLNDATLKVYDAKWKKFLND